MSTAPERYKHPTHHYATLYQRSSTTITRWMREGAPLDDPKAGPAWVATKKPRGRRRPQGVSQTPRLGSRQKVQAVTEEAKKLAETLGAPAALARLESEERAAYQALQEAKEIGDARVIKDATRTYNEIAANLLKFDREVQDSRRATGQLVPREDCIISVRAAARLMRLAVVKFSRGRAMRLVTDCADPAEARMAWLRGIHETLSIEAPRYLDTREPVPDWAAAALAEGFDINLPDPEDPSTSKSKP